jgi:hypothetical protein
VKQKLLEGWTRHMMVKRQSLHASDLILCGRKVCFEKLDPNPSADEKKIHYFQGGIQKHQSLEELLGDELAVVDGFFFV